MKPIDRSKYYKEPFKFGAQTIYKSDTLSEISLEHWKHFDEAVKSDAGLKVGDLIDNAVNVTAQQLVRFLDEFIKCESMEEFKAKAEKYIDEIQQEVKL